MEHVSFRSVRWFVLGYFVLLILILSFIGICGQLGYVFINMELACALFGLLLCSALIAGTIWLARRMQARVARIIVGSIGALLTLAAAVALLMLTTLMLNFGMPSHYTTLVSGNGRAAVIVRQISTDAALRDLRTAARAAETGAEELALSDLGYSYAAYPRVMRFFYNAKQPAEGRLEIGCTSQALLKYEWTDADTLHLFIGDAEVGDVGELTLKLN